MTTGVEGHISPESITLATRAQVLVERLKAGEIKKFRPFLERIEANLRARITAADITAWQAQRIARLLDAIASDLQAIFGEYRTALTGDLLDAAVQQAASSAKQIDAIASNAGFESVVPAANQVRAAVLSAPLSVTGYNAGQLLDPWLKSWTSAQIDQVSGTIRQGYYQGKATAEIVRALRGTSGLRYQDGVLAQIDRANTTLVRTAIQHCAQVARNETYAANSDIINGVQWVSTLDGRTTTQCRSLDGKRFPIDSGPRPPLHPACRSTTIPVLSDAFSVLRKGATRASNGASGGDQVPSGQTYYQWLKSQPASFQDMAIGPERGKLLRNGGLSAERFAELQLGNNFQPLTLEEMRRLEPVAFDRAGL